MRIYLLDDDRHVLQILKMILTDRHIGEVCGMSTVPEDALDDVKHLRPDLVIVDLLMPEMDGITFVRRTRELLPDTAFVVLSQVSDKDMIADAYRAGIEYFIQKPVNSIEVEKVLSNVIEHQSMRRMVGQMQDLLAGGMEKKNILSGQAQDESDNEGLRKARTILRRLGILGELGSREILNVLAYMQTNQVQAGEMTLSELCQHCSESPRTSEQRIRRAAANGLANLASLGLEDYGNEIFQEYANTLFNFEQVHREMECIRNHSGRHGNVKIKNFLNALYSYTVSSN